MTLVSSRIRELLQLAPSSRKPLVQFYLDECSRWMQQMEMSIDHDDEPDVRELTLAMLQWYAHALLSLADADEALYAVSMVEHYARAIQQANEQPFEVAEAIRAWAA